ncbi:hypothetical protein K1719_024007 [Acacia pycnantha]|nr:hypothetical protein K1719_024007 [Acacia pycnantha]
MLNGLDLETLIPLPYPVVPLLMVKAQQLGSKTIVTKLGIAKALYGCRNITFSKFSIEAPKRESEYDGIHIGRSTQVKILHSNIATGDDCISLGDGNEK